MVKNEIKPTKIIIFFSTLFLLSQSIPNEAETANPKVMIAPEYLGKEIKSKRGNAPIELITGTPKTTEEEFRSGTWTTIRYAKGIRIRIWIIDPLGKLHMNGEDQWER